MKHARRRCVGAPMPLLAGVLACLLAAACASAPRRATGPPPELPPLSAGQVSAYLAQLSSGERATRAAAAWLLGDTRTSRADVSLAFQAILDGADADDDDDLRAAALWGLYRAGDPSLAVLKAKPDAPAATGTDYGEPPRLIKRTTPNYPQDAFSRHIEGTVLLSIRIDVRGRVALVTTDAPNPWLDKAAIRCVAAWRFTPARLSGQPVATQATAPLSFRIY